MNIFHSLNLLGGGVVFGFMFFIYKLVKCSSKKGGELLKVDITRLDRRRHISNSWQR